MDINMITDTIQELEQDVTSFDNCEKLASLYICREYLKNTNMGLIKDEFNELQPTDTTKQELEDILPAYNKYVATKRRYQQFEVVDKMLIYAMEDLCAEITQFIAELYHNSETEAERTLLVNMINEDLRKAI